MHFSFLPLNFHLSSVVCLIDKGLVKSKYKRPPSSFDFVFQSHYLSSFMARILVQAPFHFSHLFLCFSLSPGPRSRRELILPAFSFSYRFSVSVPRFLFSSCRRTANPAESYRTVVSKRTRIFNIPFIHTQVETKESPLSQIRSIRLGREKDLS